MAKVRLSPPPPPGGGAAHSEKAEASLYVHAHFTEASFAGSWKRTNAAGESAYLESLYLMQGVGGARAVESDRK